MPIYGNVCLLVAINFRWCWWCCHHRLIHNIAKASRALNATALCVPVCFSCISHSLHLCLALALSRHSFSHSLFTLYQSDECVAYVKISFYGKWAVKQTHLNGIACINCSFGLGNHRVYSLDVSVWMLHWICRQSTKKYTYTSGRVIWFPFFLLCTWSSLPLLGALLVSTTKLNCLTTNDKQWAAFGIL